MWILPEQTTEFLNANQKAQLTVLFKALQPGDATRHVPDAEEAGAVRFINLLLARDEAVFEDITKWKILYPKALSALDQQSLSIHNKHLEELTAGESNALIAALEAGTLNSFQFNNEAIDQAGLFDMLRRHCIQGCFADPRWGGNNNGVMWKWFGYQEETKEKK